MSAYVSFEAFENAMNSAPLVHCTAAGITHEGRLFWDKRLARHCGKRGKQIRYFIDPTGPFGDAAVVFKEDGNFLTNANEVGATLRIAGGAR